MKKRILASLLALVMVLSMVPAALAAETLAPAEQPTQAADSIPAELLIPAEDNSPANELPPADDPQPVQDNNGPEINIALKAGSRIKIETASMPFGPPNIKEMFQEEEIDYDGWQLMKLVLTIPKQDRLDVTGVTPETDGLYPKLSLLEEENDHFTYSYYFKKNGTYKFDVNYTLNGVSGTKTVEYTVGDLIEVPDITMRAYLHMLVDSNSRRRYITKIDLLEGRSYKSETEYETHEDAEWGTGFDPGYHGGPDGVFSYVKKLDGIQYMQTMEQLDFWGSPYYYHKNPFDIESLEPLTWGYYPLTKRFHVTELDTTNTRLKPEAYTSEMLGAILEKMPNLSEFVANRVGFHHMESFGKMTGNNLDFLSVPQNGITSLHGLENHTGLTNIIINKNEISDLTPLKDVPEAIWWNFLQNNISDLTPIHDLMVNGTIHFGFQSVYPDPVLVSDKGESYELELPMPIDIDGNLTKVGFARFLVEQKVDQKLNISPAEKDKLLVKYAEDDTKLYSVEVRDGKSFVTIPKGDVPHANTDQAFEGSKMRFWFENDSGKDARTRGKFNGNVDFTATTVEKPATYTVTFDKNDGDTEADPNTMTVTSGSAVGKLPTAPTRTGYTFTGWNTEPDGKGTEFTAATPVTSDITVYAQWEKDAPEQLYSVSYDLNGGTGASGVDYSTVSVKQGTDVTVKAAPSKSGYTFEGWSDGNKTYQPGAVLTVMGNVTLTAQWHKNSTGGDDGNDDYILHYESNGGTKYRDERYSKNTVVKLNKVPTREGYTFTGWYADKDLTDRITSIKMTSDKTVYAGWEPTGVPEWLNGKDHFAYVMGYADGTVRPLNKISRAEVATIFFRLLNEDIREENLTTANTFADVNEGMWCNTAISTMTRLGVVHGRTAERFDPNAPITRAEFAAICARFDATKHDGDSNFTDIAGHWAEAEIERAASLGWVRGYTDGTFRPGNHITRAEAMTMINRVLNRLPEDEKDLLDGMNVWPDNQPSDWHYLAVQEATNSHDFTRKSDAVHEHWTKLTADPDWSRYQ